MATKDNGKGVAIAKRAKIGKAQQNMFIAVCLASIALGATGVISYHLIRAIQFNAQVLDETAKIRDDIKASQDGLTSLATEVMNLSTNANLESVGRENPECANYRATASTEEGSDNSTIEDISRMRTCSALRVVGDAIPPQYNGEAAMNSINKLIYHNDNSLNIENLAINDSLEYTVKVNENGLSGDDSGAATSGEDTGASNEGGDDASAAAEGDGTEVGSELNIKVIGASVSVKDSTSKVRNMMSTIEDSIRNYDIRSITISFSQQEVGDTGMLESIIELNAVYSSYYSEGVSVISGKKKICASEESTKCSKSNASSEGE